MYVEEHLREEDVVSPCSHSQWSAMRIKSLVYSSALSRPTVPPVLYPPVASPVQLFPPGAHCPSMRILPSHCARRTPASLPPASPVSRPVRRTAALRPLRPSPPDTSALLRFRLPVRRHGVSSARIATVSAPGALPRCSRPLRGLTHRAPRHPLAPVTRAVARLPNRG